jgi:3-phenylpropionate/trans-cinnamate dioxygenase ferredoxin reductase subunit
MVGLNTGADNHVAVGEPTENKFSIYHFADERLVAIESVNRPADHMMGRKMLGAGFSPTKAAVSAGADALKADLAAFQAATPVPATA